MPKTVKHPIHVPPSNLGVLIAVFIRQIALAILPLFLFYGIGTEEELMMWSGALGSIAVIVWGQVATARRMNELRDLASIVPDEIATVGDGKG